MERGAEEAITIEVTGVRVVTWLSTIVVTYVASLIVRICVVVVSVMFAFSEKDCEDVQSRPRLSMIPPVQAAQLKTPSILVLGQCTRTSEYLD